jgi:hypothetical protein
MEGGKKTLRGVKNPLDPRDCGAPICTLEYGSRFEKKTHLARIPYDCSSEPASTFATHLGFGRIVGSEIEASNMLAILV